MPFAIGEGGPALPVDIDGIPLGTAENPLVVSGAPAGAATIVDGGDVALGAKADSAVTNPASSASVIALLKGILTELVAINAILTDVHDAAGHTIKTSTP